MLIYLYNRKLYTNENKWITATQKRMAKYQKYRVKWKKPDPKKYMLSDSIYI